MTTPAAEPLVTVVVIAYNDAANLPAAVRSVTRQTLRDLEVVIVDDASTDGTGAVADALAAADPRVRAVHLDANSGGCSRPRNVGVAHARGRYLMFLDSDDVLVPHACRELAAAAERTGADLAAGRMVRYHVTRKRAAGWYDRLYTEAAALGGILDRPDLLYDTTCTNKAYRRAFVAEQGLRFPEGLHYEDLLFTTEAYCTARGIAVVPEPVYVWNVVEDLTDPAALSISNRRLDLANWRDRIDIHRRIDAYLAEHRVGRQLRAAKDTKFANHDLKLFLRDLPRYAGLARDELLALVGDYVRGLDLASCPGVQVAPRLAAFLAAAGDLPGVLAVGEYAATGQVDSDLTERDGRLYWTAAHLDGAAGRAALDVTEQGWLAAPLAELPLANVASDVALTGSTLRVRGEVRDLLGRLAALGDGVVLAAAVVSRGAGWRLPVAVHDVTRDGTEGAGGLRYAVDVDLAAVGRRVRLTDRLFRLVITVAAGDGRPGRETGVAVRGLPLDGLRVPIAGRYARLVGGELAATLVDGTLGLTLGERHPALQRAVETARQIRDPRARALRLRGALARLPSPRWARR